MPNMTAQSIAIAEKKNPSSSVVMGEVGHWRHSPRAHSFSYPMLTLQLDVDELEEGRLNSLFFRYNSWSICSVRSSDYLFGEGSLRDKIQSVLAREGVSERPFRVTLVTMPRYFGYVFNPVSFFICFDQSERVIGCLTQVTNTFGESYLYPLVCDDTTLPKAAIPVEWDFDKSFYVSPFFDTEGRYKVRVESEGKRLEVIVELFKASQSVFGAKLSGDSRPLTKSNLMRALVHFPCALLLTMPRIHWQAMLLFFRAKISPVPKPIETGPYTIRVKPNIIHRARLFLLAALRSVRDGKS